MLTREELLSEGIDETKPLLEVRDVTRTFGPVKALSGVSFEVRRGEILGLIGENGAGKSTILNIISGTDHQNSGAVYIRGREMNFSDYHEATKNGIFRVFQELALVPNMTVWENLFLSHEKHFVRAGIINRTKAIRQARALLERFDHGWIDPEAKVEDYPFAIRQILEILKAFALAEVLHHDEPILLLDEPTASLASDEIDFLQKILLKVKPHSAIVFVSHRLSELIGWSDRVVVFKDGAVVGESDAENLTEEALHHLMVGRERDREFYREGRQREAGAEDVIRVTSLGDGDTFSNVSLSVREGEIVGVAGVLGSGKNELGKAIFGAHPISSGSLEYRGTEVQNPSIRKMARFGVGYLSQERKEDGLVDTFSVAENISLARIVSKGSQILDLTRERRESHEYINKLRIKTPSPQANIMNLSGGNQQKALLARWLACGIELLILDNPTRGVDAGAKEEIYDVLRDLADDGVAILLISDDLLEIIGLSNRVAIFKDGLLKKQIHAPLENKPSETELVAAMV